MSRIKLLDCTLRDGGYVNDWKFSRKNLVSIFQRLTDAKVDIIEIGFLDERRPFDVDRSIMPDTDSADAIFAGLDPKGAMVVGMIDYGTCGIKNLKPCSETMLDGIRVIFKKHLMHEAMEFCAKVKALGYKVFSQLVSVTSYTREELIELCDLVNEVKPYAVSMVDTYGLLHPEDLLSIYGLLDERVDPSVQIGFHAHNNFQLAYANALAFIEKEGRHDIVVDGTLYGMGKSAGNAPLELLAMRLNDKFGAAYRIDPMLEAIDESVMHFYADTPWGYKPFFYLSGINRCHPNYVTWFEGRMNLSVSKVDELLAKITPEDKKLLYDKLVAERIYRDYLEGEGDDHKAKEALKAAIGDRPLLLVGPGKNILLQSGKVASWIEEKKPYVISINYLPDVCRADCVFITNSGRYHDMTLGLLEYGEGKLQKLATTNVECRNGSFDFVVNRAPLLETNEKIVDNSFLMLLKLLSEIGVRSVTCAGFDGYSDKEDNYCNPTMEYNFVKQEAFHLNRHIRESIARFRETMEIGFLTYSAYDAVEDIGSAAI